MPRILWLVYERPPHPDAVSCPAGEEDARLVLELLARPYSQRLHLAEQLRNFHKGQDRRPIADRQRVPCRRPSGLYHPVPWRLAKWLACVLPAGTAVIERTTTRIHTWLEQNSETQVVSPTAGAQPTRVG